MVILLIPMAANTIRALKPTITNLARLRQDGLVKTRRESQTIYYSIAEPVTMNIITLLQASYCCVD